MNRKCASTGAIAFESRLMVSPGAALPAPAPAAKKPETVSLARRRAATGTSRSKPSNRIACAFADAEIEGQLER